MDLRRGGGGGEKESYARLRRAHGASLVLWPNGESRKSGTSGAAHCIRSINNYCFPRYQRIKDNYQRSNDDFASRDKRSPRETRSNRFPM